MTTGSGKSEDSAADRLANMLFDSEADDSGLSKSTAEVSESMDEQKIRRAADLHLVHSLMMQISSRDETVRERRIQQVMHRIRTERKTSSGRLRNFLRPLIRYGVAAVVIISIAIFLTQTASNSAMAAMDKMITAIDQAGDRTYGIIVRDSKTRRQRVRYDRVAEMRGPQKERAILDGARLYLRGNSKFVLYRQTPSGQTVINGSDGQTRWLIRPKKPVLVSNDPEAFRVPMPEELADLLTLDFKATLLKIRENYEIRYLGDGAEEQDKDVSWMYLNARKQNRHFKGPKNLRIWAHRETGVLQRIEFVDIRLQGQPELKKLIIDLTDENPLSENWFSHEAHHPADAEIKLLRVAP